MTFTQDWFRFERLMVAARCVGAAQRLLDEATAFAKDRVVDGQRLGDHQLVAGMLADSATELFAARTMLYEVARSIDAGSDRKTLHAQASMAKLYCSEMAGRVADRAVQIFGGPGTCARTSPSGCTANSGLNESGRAPARFSGSSSPGS